MTKANEDNRYHIPKETTQPAEDRISQASRQELEKWAFDPNCIETALCLQELATRKDRTERQPAKAVEGHGTDQRQDNPFNPRTEVSADAIHIASRIVKHLWIIFVLLPFVIALLLLIVGVIK